MTNKKKIKRKKGPILCFRVTEKALDLFDAAGIDFDPPFDREYMRAMDAIEKTGTINPANYGPPPEPDEKTPPRLKNIYKAREKQKQK
jgi:hypothetical protein